MPACANAQPKRIKLPAMHKVLKNLDIAGSLEPAL